MSRSINPMRFFLAPGAKQSPASPLPHRLDESATGYSLAGCSPALPASASPAGFHAAPTSQNSQALLRRPETFRPAKAFFGSGPEKFFPKLLSAGYNNLMSWV